MLAEGHRFPAWIWGRAGASVAPIIGVGGCNGDLECRGRLSSCDLARSARPAEPRPSPNRRSIRSIARSTSPHRSPWSMASCSAPAGHQARCLHAEQSDPAALSGQRAVELGHGPVQVRADVGGVGERPRPGERLEVRQTRLQDHRPGAVAIRAQARRDPRRRGPAARAGCPRRRPGPARTSPRGSPTSAPRTGSRRGRRRRGELGTGGAPTRDRAAAPGCSPACGPGRRSCGSPDGRASRRSSPPPPRAVRPASGSRNSCTPSAGTTSIPFGLQSSEASFATNFVGATPTEHVTPTSRSTSARIFAAISAEEPNSIVAPATSRNASSSEIGSTKGV